MTASTHPGFVIALSAVATPGPQSSRTVVRLEAGCGGSVVGSAVRLLTRYPELAWPSPGIPARHPATVNSIAHTLRAVIVAAASSVEGPCRRGNGQAVKARSQIAIATGVRW